MKLNCKRINFTYTPGEEIFAFPEESGLPFIFDVEEELTADPAAMDAVGKMLDEAEELAEHALHDKKRRGDSLTLVTVPRIGAYELRALPVAQLADFIRMGDERAWT